MSKKTKSQRHYAMVTLMPPPELVDVTDIVNRYGVEATLQMTKDAIAEELDEGTTVVVRIVSEADITSAASVPPSEVSGH